MSVDSWKSFFDVVGITAVFVTFACGVGALWTGSIITIQEKQRADNFERQLEVQKEKTALAEIEAANIKREVLLLGERAPLLWNDTRLPTIAELRKFEGQKAEIFCISVTSPSHDMEPVSLSVGLRVLLRSSGWIVNDSPTMGTFQGKLGLIIEVSPKANEKTREAASTLLNGLLQVPLKVGWDNKVKEDDSVHVIDIVQILVFQHRKPSTNF